MDIVVAVSNQWLNDTVVQLLEDSNYSVQSVNMEAYAAKITEQTDVIILNCVSSDEKYDRLFAHLHRQFPQIFIIAMVSENSISYHDRLLLAGADAAIFSDDADRSLPAVLAEAAKWIRDGKHAFCKDTSRIRDVSLGILEREDNGMKEKETLFQRKFTRRSFLKGAAATAAAAVVVSGGGDLLSPLAESAGDMSAENVEQVFSGTCRGNCGGECALNVFVRNGKVVKTAAADYPEGDEGQRRICVKGYSQVQRVYNPQRLKYPLKRVGERGGDQWERISWEEAINTIADNWKDVRTKYGNNAVAFWYSYGSYGLLNGGYMPCTGIHRMRSYMSAPAIESTADLGTTHTMSLTGGSGMEPSQFAYAKTILIWGANITESYMHEWHFIADAIEAGAKVITIDPEFTGSASKSHEYIPIRPGTDNALAMAMCNVIIEQDLIDYAFLKGRSVAPLLVKENGKYLRKSDVEGVAASGEGDDPVMVWDTVLNTYNIAGEAEDPALHGTYEINGFKVCTAYDLMLERIKPYTPEKAEEICAIPTDKIRELAVTYATAKPAAIYMQQGTGHHVNSHYLSLTLAVLGSLTGNTGRPGASLGRSGFGVFIPTLDFARPEGTTQGPCIPNNLFPDIVETGMYGGSEMAIKSLYISNGNPLANEAGRIELMEAINQMELVVCADTYMTDTARFADIVLPTPHSFEVMDIHVFLAYPYVKYTEQAIPPLHESKSDIDIYRLLSEKMGFPEAFEKTDEEYLREALSSSAMAEKGMSFEDFKEKKIIRNTDKLVITGSNGTFNTATGRLQFYIENPSPRVNWGQEVNFEKECLPYYAPPNEASVENPLYEKYPLFMNSSHYRFSLQTQCSYVPYLRELDPEPIVKISRKDAEARGIKHNDIVRAFNDRGYVVLKARVTDGILPGVVSIPHGWQGDQFIEGHIQNLTSRAIDTYVSNNAFYDALCEVERWNS